MKRKSYSGIRTYSIDEMAAGNITFAATGVTYGAMLEGVRNVPGMLLAGGAFVALALKVHPAIVMVAAMGLGALFLR